MVDGAISIGQKVHEVEELSLPNDYAQQHLEYLAVDESISREVYCNVVKSSTENV